MSVKLILIAGTRLTGKDTLFHLLCELNDNFVRLAFADELKLLFSEPVYSLYKKDPLSLTPVEKEEMRPFFIQFGMLARSKNVNFWAERISDPVKEFINEGSIVVIIDTRFVSEVEYYKRIYGDQVLLINVTRHGAPEPTDEEKINGPLVAELADFHLDWPTDQSNVSLRPLVKELYSKIF